eukprot:GHVP01058238.1.p1 GENE.GHVP01058238.1~~GHVP01058238.1.p1  ORF type:complete len:116 (-),score=15.14 GHVP01058238.1:33-380(-)
MPDQVVDSLREMVKKGMLDSKVLHPFGGIKKKFHVFKIGSKYQMVWCGQTIEGEFKKCKDSPSRVCGYIDLNAEQWEKLEQVIKKKIPNFEVQVHPFSTFLLFPSLFFSFSGAEE